MRDVAIIGAGELGGSLAYVLARRDTAAGVRLVDEKARVAEGKALDVSQAGPIGPFSTRLSGSTDLGSIAGAAVVVVADRFDDGEWQGDDGLRLVRRVSELARGAVIVAACASSRELIERGVRELKLPPRRLIGSAPEAFSAAARAIVALEANASARDVALTIVGTPPHHIVISWEDATIGGFAATRVLGEPARRRIAARMPALWPPGPYALATAAAKTIDALFERTRAITCCFVAPDEMGGRRSRTTALPVRLAESGVQDVIVPALNAHDRVVLDNAMALG